MRVSRGWLRDLEADQIDFGGVVPNVIPAIPIPPRHPERRGMAIWGDCAVITPWDLYCTSGDKTVLETQWKSMHLWLDKEFLVTREAYTTIRNPSMATGLTLVPLHICRDIRRRIHTLLPMPTWF